MKIKIEKNEKIIKFKEVPIGDCIRYNFVFFLKTTYQKKYNCIILENGNYNFIPSEALVEHFPNSALIIQ